MTTQNQIKTLILAIIKNGIDGLIDTATALYKNEVRNRLPLRTPPK